MRTHHIVPVNQKCSSDSTSVLFCLQIFLVPAKQFHLMELTRVMPHTLRLNHPTNPWANPLHSQGSENVGIIVVCRSSGGLMSPPSSDDKTCRTSTNSRAIQKMKFFAETYCIGRRTDGTNSTFSNTTGSTTSGLGRLIGAVTTLGRTERFGFDLPVQSGSVPVCLSDEQSQLTRLSYSILEREKSALWD
jgi:hypothetical protein